MSVSGHVHPLIGGDSQHQDLVHLAHPQARDPDAVEPGHEHDEEDPGGAGGRHLERA